MPGTTQKRPITTVPRSDQREQQIQHNKLVDDVELLRARLDAMAAKLDADAGVTDTNYQSGTYGGTSRVQSTTTTAAKIANPKGVVVTS